MSEIAKARLKTNRALRISYSTGKEGAVALASERALLDARIERLEAVVKDLLPLADAWTDERMLGEGPILAARAALEDA